MSQSIIRWMLNDWNCGIIVVQHTTWQRGQPAWRARAVAAGALLVLITGQRLLPLIAAFLIVADPLQSADALVPLAGDPARVGYATELFRRGYARWFIITSMQFKG